MAKYKVAAEGTGKRVVIELDANDMEHAMLLAEEMLIDNLYQFVDFHVTRIEDGGVEDG